MSVSSKIMDRIKRDYGEELFEVLSSEMSSPDLQSLLLEVYRQRVADSSPRQLAKQFKENRFVQPSSIDPRLFLKLDELAFFLSSDYEAIELSPLSPLGCNAIIAPVDQNNAISTIRNTEVCSDSTNMLALIAAQRRAGMLRKNAKSSETVKLSASHRVVRGQLFQGEASVPHFRLFSFVTAGRDTGSFSFQTKALAEHIEFYLQYLQALTKFDICLRNIIVNITDFSGTKEALLESDVLVPLMGKYENIKIQFDPDREQGNGYYEIVGFQIFAQHKDESNLLLIDGGFTNWTQQVLNNNKERLLISGMGVERICMCFPEI
jgi:hypothetical protein